MHIGVFPEDTSVTNASVGLPTLSTNPRDAGLSLISIAGYLAGRPRVQQSAGEHLATRFQINDTATAAFGAHLVKAGVEWYGVRQSAYRDVQARGFLTFVQQAYTGNALADLLLGLPALTGGARLDNPQNLRASTFSLFAHDDWRVGAAADASRSACATTTRRRPPTRTIAPTSTIPSTGAVVPVGTGNMPRGGYEADGNNFAPARRLRLDASTSCERWVVRGGYGIYYNQGALATAEGLYFNPPYFNLSVYFPVPGPAAAHACRIRFRRTSRSSFRSRRPPISGISQTPWLEHWNVNVQHQFEPRPRRSKSPMSARAATT